MRQVRMTRVCMVVAACVLLLAGCGHEDSAPAPREERERPTEAQSRRELRGAALAARCKQIVREAGANLRLPLRQVNEPFPAYGRRVARATARIADVYSVGGRSLSRPNDRSITSNRCG